MKNVAISIFVFLNCIVISSAQDLTNSHKIFSTLSSKTRLTKKTDLLVNLTGIGDIQPFKYDYIEVESQWLNQYNKKANYGFGLNFISIREPNENSFKPYLKFSALYNWERRFWKFEYNQGIEFEYYIPKFNKFQHRLSYEFEVTTRKSITKLKLKPYSKFRVYYYGNGKYLPYYNDEGELLALKSPNDIHRWRWTTGVKFKTLMNLNISIAYLWNEEFNAGIFPNSNINIYNKNKTGIRYPYNSYGAFQVVIHKNLHFKRKKNQSNEEQHSM